MRPLSVSPRGVIIPKRDKWIRPGSNSEGGKGGLSDFPSFLFVKVGVNFRLKPRGEFKD